MDDASIAEILKRLEESATDSERERRQTPRYTYNVKGCVIHLQPQGGGPPTSYLVPTRNISNSGMGFLHGSFIYPGSKCVVQLISMHGTWQNVQAEVTRCDYISSGVHDIGLRFVQNIDASEFCAEAAPCRVLIVDDNPAIVRLAETLLKSLNAEINSANSGEAAIELALASIYDVILLDMDMPVMDGFEVVKNLREKGYSGTIVAATGMTQPGDKDKCIESGCNSYIPKPFGREQFASLLQSLRQEPLLSSFAQDRQMLPLIDSFIKELPLRIREIETAYSANDLDALLKACRNLKGEAGSFGFEPISSAASDVENAVHAEKTKAELKKPFSDLVRLCSQARASTRT
jgi:CheY-like chemotaxis protein